jgi:hypothetical protein
MFELIANFCEKKIFIQGFGKLKIIKNMEYIIRVRALIKHNGKTFLVKNNGRDFYCLPG